jgi:hypothetical protein
MGSLDSRRGFVGKLMAGAAIAARKIPLESGGLASVSVEIGKPVTINKARIFVNPPMVRIGSGATQIAQVTLVNNSGGDIRVWLPHGAKLFDDRSVADWSVPFLIPKDTDRTLYVKPNPQEGKYDYHIYCEAIEDYAEGNSPPILSCP